MKEYKVNFLSNKEFDNLPFQRVKESQGCADQKTRTAYIRKSGIPVVDQFVTAHEIEELVSKNSNHEDTDGIRYKGGNFFDNVAKPVQKNIIQPINSAIKATGLDTVLNGASIGATVPFGPGGNTSATQQTGINTSTASKPYGPVTQAQNRLGFTNLNQINSATPGQGGYGINTPPNTINMGNYSALPPRQASNLGFSTPTINTASTNPIAGMPSASGQGLAPSAQSAYSSISPSAKTPGETNTDLMQGATASNLGFQAPTKANVPLQTINQAAVSPSLQGGGEVSNVNQDKSKEEESSTPWLDNIFGKDWRQSLIGGGIKAAAGLGVAALGQGMAGKPQTVNSADSALFNQVVERVQSGAQVEMTPAQKLAITQNYDQQLEQARKNITQRFKALRPGSDISNDSQLQQALIELENDFAEQKATAITAAQLGLTQQQTAQLSQLAAYDINSLATTAGISNQEAADFKKMMADFGGMIAMGGQNRVYIQK